MSSDFCLWHPFFLHIPPATHLYSNLYRQLMHMCTACPLHCLQLYDEIRIDHFRAFAGYWAIPADAETGGCHCGGAATVIQFDEHADGCRLCVACGA